METGIELLGIRDELSEDNLKYLPALKEGAKYFSIVHETFNSPDFHSKEGWKKEAEDGTIKVHSKQTEFGRLFNVHVGWGWSLTISFVPVPYADEFG
jgi:hypothetical protein